MRHITQDGLDLIKRFEGFSETVYICPAGFPTIGYGHVVKVHENFSCGISKSPTFNLGAGSLQRSTLRRKINREEHEDVPAEFLRWVWAGGKKLCGLVRRRKAEIISYNS
jgi:lysozyme